MLKIPLTVKKTFIDIKRNGLVIIDAETPLDYQAQTPSGLIVLQDEAGEHGFMCTNPIHPGGNVIIHARPLYTPTKPYKPGQVIGYLLKFE